MTNDITHLPASLAIPAIDQARYDLESSLTNVFGVAHILMALATADSVEADELSYLGGQLIEHERLASDAFNRIYKIGDYREQDTPAELPDPTPLADDAAFLGAERELFEVKRQLHALDEREHRAEHEKLIERMHDLEDLIGNSPPHSLVSVAVKLRRLVAPEGIDAGPADSDIVAVHQVHAFVEKLIAGDTEDAPDPVPALFAERTKICILRGGPGHSDDEMEALNSQVGVLDNRIADIVAPSADGILAQFELLMELTEPAGWSDNRDRRLMETIKAGLSNLTGDAK